MAGLLAEKRSDWSPKASMPDIGPSRGEETRGCSYASWAKQQHAEKNVLIRFKIDYFADSGASMYYGA